MLIRLVQLTVALTVLAGAIAAAAALGVSSGTVQAGIEADLQCDENGVNVAYTVSGNNITKVTVSNINPDCFNVGLGVGVNLIVRIQSTSGTVESSSVPLSTTTKTVNLSTPIAIANLLDVTITIIGRDVESPNQDCPC